MTLSQTANIGLKARPNAHPMIFVAGLARAGTTLFQAIFSQHPQVFSFPETHFFEAVASLGMFDGPLDSNALDLLGAEVLRRDGLDGADWCDIRSNIRSLERGETTVDLVFNAIVQYYQVKLGHQPTDYALEKTPGHVFQLDRILRMYPQARVFLLRRNPRDYANSISKCTWGPGSIRSIGMLWSETIGLIESYAQRAPEQVSVVDYERLVGRPGPTMAKCFEQVGLEFRNEYLENLSTAGMRLVKRSEFSWKQENLTRDSVVNRQVQNELTLGQQFRLMLAISPASMWRYKLGSQRH